MKYTESDLKNILIERKAILESKFKNTKYIFDDFDYSCYWKEKQFILFHDNDGYKYKMRYKAILDIDFVNDTNLSQKITLTSQYNPYSLDNIKLWIKKNCNFSQYVSGEYVNNTRPLVMKCLKCGGKYEMSWNSIQSGRGCGICCNNKKKTNEEFLLSIYNLVGNEYTFLEEYKGSSKKIFVKHNICGYTYSIRPIDFIIGYRCDKCGGTLDVSKEEFMQRLTKKHNQKFILIGEYNGWTKPCKFKCNDCGNIIIKTPKVICRETYGCYECYIKSISLSGNPSYTNGASTIYDFLRGATHLWRVDSFVRYNSRCIISNKRNDNEIHHVNIPFRKIIDRCHKELGLKQGKFLSDYNEKDLFELKDLCLKIHQNEVIGVVLNKEIHREFHTIYGNKNNNYEQFIEFGKSKDINIEDIISDNRVVL